MQKCNWFSSNDQTAAHLKTYFTMSFYFYSGQPIFDRSTSRKLSQLISCLYDYFVRHANSNRIFCSKQHKAGSDGTCRSYLICQTDSVDQARGLYNRNIDLMRCLPVSLDGVPLESSASNKLPSDASSNCKYDSSFYIAFRYITTSKHYT